MRVNFEADLVLIIEAKYKKMQFEISEARKSVNTFELRVYLSTLLNMDCSIFCVFTFKLKMTLLIGRK